MPNDGLIKEGNARVVIDEAIFPKIAAGDNEAMRGLYEISYRPVFALLLSFTQNYHDAEDLLQETYINIRRGADLYQPRGNPMAWIMKIARNVFLSYRRSGKLRQYVEFEEVENRIPLEKINEVEDRILIAQMMKVLNEDERSILILHVVDGMKFREIGDILDKPTGTVLSMYHRGLKKLRKSL